MEDEFLAPTEISFTTPFKQAYRAPMGKGNADDSYENNERYNCDDDDDDDLNFISSNMQHLALSEKKGRNRRQNVSGVSPNSGPGLNLTFDMGVAESKENSVQEESPSFLNFGGGVQPATAPITPGSAQKAHSRSAHASPSCPTTTATTPGSASPRDPDPDLTSAITPPSEGPTKKQIITPLGVCTETEKSEKLCARFPPPYDIDTSEQNLNSFPREIDVSAQKNGAKNCNIETQKPTTSFREQFAAEQKLYEDFCIPQNTPSRGLNISVQKQDALEDFDVDYLQQCSPHEILTNEETTPPREHNVSTYQQDAPAENLSILNENFSFNTEKQGTPLSRDITETQIESSPGEGEVLLQNQGTPETFCSEPYTQLIPTHELALSTVKPSTPESKYLDAETTENERLGDVSMEKNGSTQKLFLEAKVETTPPRDVDISSQPQYCTRQDFTRETEPQTTSIQNNVSTDQQDATAENLTILNENFSFNTEKQGTPPSRDITETQIQCSPGEGEVLLQYQGTPKKVCSEPHTQLTPTRELALSTVKPLTPEPKYFDAETEKEQPGDVSMEKTGSPQQYFLETKMENTSHREANISSQTQYCTPQDFISETQPQITSIQNNASNDQKNAAAENLSILNENFSFNTQKQRTPSREINETQIQSSPGEAEGEVLLQYQGTPEKKFPEPHTQLTPTHELALSAVTPSTPGPKYFDAETEKIRPGDVSMEKTGSPQQLFLETKVENTPPREVNISSQTQYYTPQDFTSETEPQIISMLNEVSILKQESPSLSPEKQHQGPPERDNNTSVNQREVPDEFNLETQKQKSPSPPCELNVVMQNEAHENFSYGSQKRSISPTIHPSSQKQESPQVIFEKQYQQTPPPELNIPANKQEIPDYGYFETQMQRSPPRETSVLQSQRNQDAKFSQKQSSPPAPPARDVSIQKQGNPTQLFSESAVEDTLSWDVNASGQKQPTSVSDLNVFICVSEKQSSPQRDISMLNQGNPQQLFLQTQNQSTPPRELHLSARNHGEFEDSTNKIENVVTPFREQVSMTNPNTPLLVDFNASALKQNIPSWDTNDSKQKQSTGLHKPSVAIRKHVGSENFIFQSQKQATPPRDYSIPLQNPCTPLLVDFNVSAHKQRSPPREINAVTVTQQQGMTQDYGVMINTMETLQLKTPPTGSSNSNFSAQTPGTPLLVDFGNGVSSQRQRQNVQPQELRYNNQGEYSPPPDRIVQTRKQSTPSPHASMTSCTTPTSEPSLMGMKTPHPALKRLQDELLSQETILEEQVEARDEILKQKEFELATIYKKIDGLKSHRDKEGKTLIKKYEATIANYTTELENLRASFAKSESKNVEVIKDRDQTYSDLRNVENAYNDLMGKYLRAKEMVGSLADTERHYNSRDEAMLHCLAKREQKIELLKNQIEEMLELTYQEYDTKLREKRHDNENLRVRLMRMEMRVDTLENDIEQKTRENAQLHTLCDEIISGRVAE